MFKAGVDVGSSSSIHVRTTAEKPELRALAFIPPPGTDMALGQYQAKIGTIIAIYARPRSLG